MYKGKKIDVVVTKILEDMERKSFALSLGVTEATISSWLLHCNTPRIEVASKIYGRYGYVVWPYSEEALSETLRASE